jgi:GH15 family glucan-1,4-alpha-glucosidase
MEALYQVLESMRLSNGAYIASPSVHYNYVWLRDVCYTVLPYLHTTCDRYVKAYHAILDILREYEWKIDIHTRNKPVYSFEYIHSRYTVDLEESAQPWGHAQNDALGIVLWGIGQGVIHGKQMLRDKRDYNVLQKLVNYLACMEYWQAPDNGMWEEAEEVHASSLGAVIQGLRAVQLLIDVPQQLISKGEVALDQLLPRESVTKEVDLALLSLIYPFRLVHRKVALQILQTVTEQLEGPYGCMRYRGDKYFNEGQEAQWCFGLPWLGLCYWTLGDKNKVIEYWNKTKSIVPCDYRVPELYIGGRDIPNENTPLAWSVAMVISLSQVINSIDSD